VCGCGRAGRAQLATTSSLRASSLRLQSLAQNSELRSQQMVLGTWTVGISLRRPSSRFSSLSPRSRTLRQNAAALVQESAAPFARRTVTNALCTGNLFRWFVARQYTDELSRVLFTGLCWRGSARRKGHADPCRRFAPARARPRCASRSLAPHPFIPAVVDPAHPRNNSTEKHHG
jgi:hypothetical protein